MSKRRFAAFAAAILWFAILQMTTSTQATAASYDDYLAVFLQKPVAARKNAQLGALDAARLAADIKSASGPAAIGAQILQGWKQNAKSYEEVLAQKSKDQMGRDVLVRLTARSTDPKLLGLVLELLLDPEVGNPIRRDAEAYATELTGRNPLAFRVPLLAVFEALKDKSVRASIAKLVAGVEPDPAKLADLAAKEVRDAAGSTAAADNLLTGMSDNIDDLEKAAEAEKGSKSKKKRGHHHAAVAAPGPEAMAAQKAKDAAAKEFWDALPGAGAAERTDIVHALADMEAANSDELLADYVKSDLPEAEKLWAVGKLEEFESETAVRALGDIVTAKSASGDVQLLAIDQYARRPFSAANLDVVKSVIDDANRDASQKYAALKVFNAWLTAAKLDGNSAEEAAIANAVKAVPRPVLDALDREKLPLRDLKLLRNEKLLPIE